MPARGGACLGPDRGVGGPPLLFQRGGPLMLRIGIPLLSDTGRETVTHTRTPCEEQDTDILDEDGDASVISSAKT
jgi:hypothetical protein